MSNLNILIAKCELDILHLIDYKNVKLTKLNTCVQFPVIKYLIFITGFQFIVSEKSRKNII